MPKKTLGAEQIVTKLRQVEVLQSQGKSIAAACKETGLTEQSYYRYRKEYGGLNVEQARKLKQLELENGRLKKLVADLSLEKQVLKDIAEATEGPRQRNLQAPSDAGRPLMRFAGGMTSANAQPAGLSGNHVGRRDTFQR
jgi:transposase-like protein